MSAPTPACPVHGASGSPLRTPFAVPHPPFHGPWSVLLCPGTVTMALPVHYVYKSHCIHAPGELSPVSMSTQHPDKPECTLLPSNKHVQAQGYDLTETVLKFGNEVQAKGITGYVTIYRPSIGPGMSMNSPGGIATDQSWLKPQASDPPTPR